MCKEAFMYQLNLYEKAQNLISLDLGGSFNG